MWSSPANDASSRKSTDPGKRAIKEAALWGGFFFAIEGEVREKVELSVPCGV
jgi:hypothetical protein